MFWNHSKRLQKLLQYLNQVITDDGGIECRLKDSAQSLSSDIIVKYVIKLKLFIISGGSEESFYYWRPEDWYLN